MKAFREVGPFLELASLPLVEATAERVAQFAQSFSPDLSGALRDSIKVQGSGIDKAGAYADVGTREPYAIYQEFGTVHNPAHPFMRPAIAAATGSALGFITSKINLAPRKRK